MNEQRKIQMRHAWYLDSDTPVVFNRSIVGWITQFGGWYVVRLRKVGKTWVARKQFGLEPIGLGKTARAALLQAKAHYDSLVKARVKRICDGLEGKLGPV